MQQFDQYVKLNKKIPPEILTSISSIDDAGRRWARAQGFVGNAGQTCLLPGPDGSIAGALYGLGALPDRIELTGPITATLPPLSANEAERQALAQILGGRHVWLAAAPTLPEARAVLAAHQAALHHNHRALLIIADLPPEPEPEVEVEPEVEPYVATWAQSVADKEPVDVVRETGERVRRVALEILDKLPDAGIGDGYPPGLDRTGPDAERETSRARTVELGTATPVRTTATVDVSVPAL